MADTQQLKERVFDAGEPGWVQVEEPKGSFFMDKLLLGMPEAPLVINLTRYPKGYWKPCHRHSMSHALYVIEGKLKTDRGVYGPGTLVWHPEGLWSGHGATDDEDCLFLFIADKPFDIEFRD